LPINVKRGFTKSCGHIGTSYAENQIFNFLNSHQIPFVYNSCPFDGLVNPETNHKLYLDFVITKEDGEPIVIEHQGIQHYYNGKKANEEFGKLQRESTDRIKKDYFADHNIKFYETRYDEDYIDHLIKILNENGFHVEPNKGGEAYDY